MRAAVGDDSRPLFYETIYKKGMFFREKFAIIKL